MKKKKLTKQTKQTKQKKLGGTNLNSRQTITIKRPDQLEWHENILFGIKQIIDPAAASQQLENDNDEYGIYELDNRYDFTSTVITIVIAMFCIGLIIIMIYLLYRTLAGPDEQTKLSSIFTNIDKTIYPLQSIHNDPSWPEEYYERELNDKGDILAGSIKLKDGKKMIFNPLDETPGLPDANGHRKSNWHNFISKFDELAFIFNQPGGGIKKSHDCMQLKQTGGTLAETLLQPMSTQAREVPRYRDSFSGTTDQKQYINPNWHTSSISSIDKIKNFTGDKLIQKIQNHFASFTYNNSKYITFKLDSNHPQPSVFFDNIKEYRNYNKFF